MHIRHTVVPMRPRVVSALPPGGGHVFEPKFDGYRAIGTVREDGRVTLTSRRGTDLTPAFPEIVSALYVRLKPGTVVDGEIVRWVGGRLDLGALQRRYANRRRAKELGTAEPAHYVLFDVLEVEGRDLRERTLAARRVELERLLYNVGSGNLLEAGLQTDDLQVARKWFETLPTVGIEGLVIKPVSSRYIEGDARTWTKLKAHFVTTAIVGGVTGDLSQPDSLIVGRRDTTTGELRIAGRTSRISDPSLATEVGQQLTPAGDEHPWPPVLPPTFGQREPVAYTRVEPGVVVEIRADAAVDGMRWRHVVRLLRLRTELHPMQVPTDLDLA